MAIPKDQLTKLLAPALGEEKSEEVVVETARGLGFAVLSVFSATEVRALFDALSKVDGLIGVVARFAVSRGDVDALVENGPADHAITQRVDDASPAEVRASAVDLLPLLAPALGTEKARDVVTSAAARLGLDPESLSREQAAAVLDELAQSAGIVGVVARFAKKRLLLEE